MQNPLSLKRQRCRSPHPLFWDSEDWEEKNHCIRLPWWVLIYSVAIGVILLLATISVIYP